MGDPAICDCDAAAMQFLDSVQATFALPAMLGDPPCADEAAVRQGAAIFWQGRATLPAITPRAP